VVILKSSLTFVHSIIHKHSTCQRGLRKWTGRKWVG